MGLDPTLITNALANWQRPADPLAAYAKLQALKNGVVQQQAAQQQLQSGALDLQEKQKAVQDQQALSDAFKASYAPDPTTGKLTLDENALYRNMSTGGLGAKIPAVQKSIQDANESAVKFKQTQTAASEAAQDYLGQQLLYVKDAKYDPATFTATLGAAVSHGAIPAAEAAQLTQRLQQNPTAEGVQSLVDPLITASKTAQGILTTRQTAQSKTDTVDIARDKEKVTKIKDALDAVAGATSQDDLNAKRSDAIAAGASPAQVNAIPMQFDPNAITKYRTSRLTPDQAVTTAATAARDAATEADRKVTQAQNARRIAIEGQNAGLQAQKFAMEFGGDAVKGWAKQIADNPDTANQVPPALRTAVMQRFTADTGLPYPKPLAGTAVDQERASRNALDAVSQIKEALADPEIQSRIGPILGRLGNAEQRAGMALGLSPAAEAKAQQLRTNMRYLVFQEGKSLMGGRIPQQLMTQLEQSSPGVTMDAGTLNGAMAGVTDAANRNLDQTFKQRYGDTVSRPAPGAKPPAAAAPIPADVKAALAKTGPGIHTLSDGTKWLKAVDGTITPQ